MVIRTALVVWEERAKFCDEQAGWRLAPILAPISSRLEEQIGRASCRERVCQYV